MNEVHEKLSALQSKGWTLAALSDELGVHHMTVRRWETGDRFPENAKMVLMGLEAFLKRKRVPKQRRYAPDSRHFAARTPDRTYARA